jgi:hypothetical protein
VKIETWNDDLVKEGLYDHAEIQFGMSDCSRKISLEFFIGNKEGMSNSLHKLDNIIAVCTSMKEDLKKARLEIRKGVIRAKELKELKESKK